jgi:hypothetical protein
MGHRCHPNCTSQTCHAFSTVLMGYIPFSTDLLTPSALRACKLYRNTCRDLLLGHVLLTTTVKRRYRDDAFQSVLHGILCNPTLECATDEP